MAGRRLADLIRGARERLFAVREDVEYPSIRTLLRRGVVRTFLEMAPEKRRAVVRDAVIDTLIWMAGMGLGRMFMKLVRELLEEAAQRLAGGA